MKFIHGVLLLLITTYGIFESVQAQDQSGFISLACGLVPKETTYTEKTTNIKYTSDANYTDSGLVGRINDAYKTQFQQQTWTLRSFPKGERNCYNFNLTANSKYLIRGTFVYGNYDGLNQIPNFDLHIGPNKWTSVILDGVADASIFEMIHVLAQDRLQVCLVKTGETIPFISSLELRPLNNNTYVTQSGSLIMVSRNYFSTTPPFVRYNEDIHDRTWVPYLNNKAVTIRTDLLVDTSNDPYDVPQPVATTASVPANASQPLTLDWTLDNITALSYVYMHFAEIQNLTDADIREFTITSNGGKVWYSNLRPPKLQILTVFSQVAMSSPDGKLSFSFTRTGNSTLPPLINGLEIYKVLDLIQLDTGKDEVSAMLSIKITYELTEKVSWQGDPCAPQFYRWEGLNCSYPDSEPPRIISLNLSGSNLSGTITPEISKLTQLIELDLSNNDLSGEIPSFFADMKLLKLINLRGNPSLNSTIPDSLQQKINRKSVTLILSETVTPKGRGKKVPVVAIAATVAGVIALLVILAIFFVVRRKNAKSANGPPPSVTTSLVKSDTRSSNPSIMTKERRITYTEVLKMTNNFERVLGKGGFGTVYHGNLDDAEVAVKMLSHSSSQGYKEFKAEVELLLRVHHRHLVGLVGYCDDGDNLALIYEYMANGDLKENMSGKRDGHVLTWENRMQIAVEAAQGLEYLHNGCTPPMVHRDVKTTNILLNERSGAKLADFGLSRSFPIDGECHVSTVVAGTPGYLDPEYYRTNWLSEKSDVYSFGVVLLEIVTNQPVIDKTRERPHISEWVGFMLTKGDIKSIVDPKLIGDYDTNGAWKIVELALGCLNPSSNQRPTMAHVVMELNECVALENARRKGSEEMYSRGSDDFSRLSSASEFAPGAR
ncbi:putative LRR receptor-like serine/threonine-protein kinase [Cardamine amara subsp. amara]|uniref:non-specific serine/threonine protein kinase n=1 Tax=Cardamine amara subsp. amara TaxID=228776 RepID=A0ABD1AXN2_CARAN